MSVETNLILFDTVEPAASFLEKLAAHGIKALSTHTHRIRFVLHLDVHPDMVEYVAEVLSQKL